MSAMLKLSLNYLDEFIKTAASLIMPVLDAIVTILFGTSDMGKIMRVPPPFPICTLAVQF
jgi:hypothetical protein